MQSEILQPEGRQSHQIKVTNSKGETFKIPVIDVRDGERFRRIANRLVKADNTNRGSKFMKPSFSGVGRCYQTSHKN